MNDQYVRVCNRAISQLEPKDVERFVQINDDAERIKFLYQHFDRDIELTPGQHKDALIALALKKDGNEYYEKKELEQALETYNKGIIFCPNGEEPDQELLATLIANRSAVLFELRQYESAIADIDYVLKMNKYPKKSLYKLFFRKGRCKQALNKTDNSFQLALKYFESYSGFSDAEKVKQSQRMSKLMKERPPPAAAFYLPSYPKWDNEQNFTIDFSEEAGHFVRASKNFGVGEVIVEDRAFAFAVGKEQCLTNCQVCSKSIANPVACPECTSVVFCVNCPIPNFHKVECKIYPTLLSTKAALNTYIALRSVTQHPSEYFFNKMQDFKSFLIDDYTEEAVEAAKLGDCLPLFNLCRNENKVNKKELLQGASMAIFLAKLLRHTDFYANYEGDDYEIFIASMILRAFEVLKFNSHEISEMKTFGDFSNEQVGIALYPVAARFNHSCEPSVLRYNVRNKLVLRAIKPIRANEVIYENYGPVYSTVPKSERQKYLREKYLFECSCIACMEDWPVASSIQKAPEEFGASPIMLKCQTEGCSYCYKYRNEAFSFTCKICGKVNEILPIVMKLLTWSLPVANFADLDELYNCNNSFNNALLQNRSRKKSNYSEQNLDPKLKKAEVLFISRRYDQCFKIYVESLTNLFSCVKLPYNDVVLVQDRLRTILLLDGNHAFLIN